MTPELDIVIPVYNEGRNIVAVLAALTREVTTPARVLICYDRDEDDTLPAIRANPQAHAGLPVEFVRNITGRGVHGAVTTGFAASAAPFVLMFPAASFDGALLSGVVHHFPDPSPCAAETFRLLRPRGRFLAFDPNRMNPFMWLYRDHASPFYSSVGVTENERPVLAREVAAVFERAGFAVSSHYLSGLAYRYVASRRAQLALPLYNFIDSALFGLPVMERLRPFVLTAGAKR